MVEAVSRQQNPRNANNPNVSLNDKITQALKSQKSGNKWGKTVQKYQRELVQGSWGEAISVKARAMILEMKRNNPEAEVNMQLVIENLK